MKDCCKSCKKNDECESNTIEKKRPKKKENVIIEKFKDNALYLMFKDQYVHFVNTK